MEVGDRLKLRYAIRKIQSFARKQQGISSISKKEAIIVYCNFYKKQIPVSGLDEWLYNEYINEPILKTIKLSSRKKRLKAKYERVGNYRAFLKTPYWKEVRIMVLARDKKTCVKCGSKKKLQVHHLTYKNHGFEKENLQDLITLCSFCHKKEHNL